MLNGVKKVLHCRLEKEREVIKEECKEKPEITSKIDKTKLQYELKGAKPGTEVEGQKDWIVGKYGQVLPVVKIRRKDKKKVSSFMFVNILFMMVKFA